jgi:hypothetical protein
MAIIQSGAAPTNLLTVDPTFAAIRVSDHPPELLGAYSISATSGAILTPAAVTSSAGTLFSFRYVPPVSTQLCMIRRVEVILTVATGFAATAQNVGVGMIVARSFSASDSGGTAIATNASGFTATMQKHRTTTGMQASAFSTSSGGSGDIRIASTTALTAGTRTLDTYPLGSALGGVVASAAAGTNIVTSTPIFQHQPGDYPLILATSEGFILGNLVNIAATGAISLTVNVEWMEIAATTGNAIAY